jgi:RNA polymerase sigma-70 factor (ECF subfamily)
MRRDQGAANRQGPADERVRALVKRARGGEGEAFGELVRLFEAQALSVALRVLGHPEDARDVVQEGFLRAFRYLRSYRLDRPFRAWLLRIVLHEALDSRRHASRRFAGEAAPESGPRAEPPGQERGLLAAETRRTLEGLLRELSPRERAAFVLRDVEGWPTAEVAEALGCRQVTVRRHLSLARRRLRQLLRSRHPEILEGLPLDSD